MTLVDTQTLTMFILTQQVDGPKGCAQLRG